MFSLSGKTALVTGASRGIGLGLARGLLAEGYVVMAAARNPDTATDLLALQQEYGSQIEIPRLDVADEAEIEALARQLDGRAIDLLINNAGIFLSAEKGFSKVTAEQMTEVFRTNTLGPLLVTQKLLPNLQAADAPVVAVISSSLGSLGLTSGRMYSYRASKAALNMILRSFALDYPRIRAVVFDPGWVQTDMSPGASVTVERSVSGMLGILSSLKAEDSGRFFTYQGKELPW